MMFVAVFLCKIWGSHSTCWDVMLCFWASVSRCFRTSQSFENNGSYLPYNKVSCPRSHQYCYVPPWQDDIPNLCKVVGCPAAAMWLTWEFAPRPVCRIPPDVQMEYVAVLAWLSIDGNAVVCAVKLLMFTSRWCNILIINGNVSIKGTGIPSNTTLIICFLCLISPHPVQDVTLSYDNVKVVPLHTIQQY